MQLPGFLFKRRYTKLLPILQRGRESELRALLWQPREPRINYMPVTVSILQRLQVPTGVKGSLSIERIYSTWNFDLVIFYTPWGTEKNPYQPLIFYRRKRKAAGVILPWNELHGYLTKAATDQIFELGKIWIRLTLELDPPVKR